LKKWHLEYQDLWIIYIPKNLVDIEDFPAIKNHLLKFREKLEKRATKQGWFELQQAQYAYKKSFDQPKILYPDIAQESKFSLDEKGRYLANTIYFLPTDDPFLLALLNSNVIWFYWRGISNAIRGGFFRLFTQYVETTPIPDATDAQKAAIADLARRCQETAEARYAAQEAVRRRIPDLCPVDREPKLNTNLKNWWALDFKSFRKEVKKCFKTDIPLAERNEWDAWLSAERAKIEEFSRTLTALEAELNQQVYALFDLTADEIALIEEEIAQ
jgi:hypothetical protein